MCVCVCSFVYVCVCVCMYVCMYVCICMVTWEIWARWVSPEGWSCMYVCVYVCIYVCMYVSCAMCHNERHGALLWTYYIHISYTHYVYIYVHVRVHFYTDMHVCILYSLFSKRV